MTLSHSPNIVRDGLVLYLDAANEKSYRSYENLLNVSTWLIGTGSVEGFTSNGSESENERIFDIDPWGNSNIVWQALPDATSDPDGGWYGDKIPIDRTKMYRVSVWVNRKVQGADGRFYLGLEGWNAAGSQSGVIFRTDGTTATSNPYFWNSPSPPSSELPTDTWVLVVGHVWPDGSGAGDNNPDSGRYTISGGRFGDITRDYIWNTDTTDTNHRSYLFYTTDITVRQQWINPRIDLIDGNEPSIQDLLDNKPNVIYDLKNKNKNGAIIGRPLFSSDNNGTLTFGGIKDSIYIDGSGIDFSTGQTISMILKKGAGAHSARRNPYNQAYGGYGTITSETDGGFSYYHGTNGANDTPYDSFRTITSIPENELVMLTLTRDTNNVAWYINGELDVTEATVYPTTVSSVDTIIIGDGYAGPPFLGEINNVMLYDRGLSATEVKQNFNALRSRYEL
jgi:hypothetical protein